MFVFVLWQSGESTLVSVSASEIEESSCSFKAGRLRKVKQKKKRKERERERGGGEMISALSQLWNWVYGFQDGEFNSIMGIKL